MADNLRVDQVGFEVIGPPVRRLRVDQLAFEICGPYRDNLRVDQLAFEACGTLSPLLSRIRVDQLAFEACGAVISPLRVNQLTFEVCGKSPIDGAFIVTLNGNLAMDTTASIHVETESTGLVDTGASVTLHDSTAWVLADSSSFFALLYGQCTCFGQSTLTMEKSVFTINGRNNETFGVVTFGKTGAATTPVTLGNGTDSASLYVTGTFTADDTSSITLGTIPSLTGPAELTIGYGATLALSEMAFSLVGALDLEDVDVQLIGGHSGDNVTTSGVVLANFAWAEEPGGGVPYCVFFTDTSYEPNPVTWAWTFGDGGTSGLQNPNYAYSGPGSYVVTLTIDTGAGASTMTRTITVT